MYIFLSRQAALGLLPVSDFQKTSIFLTKWYQLIKLKNDKFSNTENLFSFSTDNWQSYSVDNQQRNTYITSKITFNFKNGNGSLNNLTNNHLNKTVFSMIKSIVVGIETMNNEEGFDTYLLTCEAS